MVKMTARPFNLQDKFIKAIAWIFPALLSLLCLLPMMRIVAQAFSDEIHVSSGEVGLIPIGFNLDAFFFVINSSQFQRAVSMSILSTIVFTLLAMVLTVTTAYPLSRMYLPGVRYLNFFIVFTLLFNGGLIPTYLVVKSLGILNTFWALIVPNMISAFNVILMVSFMRNIPVEFEEAAKLEGASQYTILFRIIIPLSKPTIATLVLFYAVARWNMWFDVIMYVTDSKYYTLQVVLRNLLMALDNTIMKSTVPHASPLISVQAASVIFAILPILTLYPFLQKYFVKGIMLGGVKG